jgi:hypothetical protein
MYDNRRENEQKRAKGDATRRPDFKCKDKDGCGGVIWPPREKAAPKGAAKGAQAGAPSANGTPAPPKTKEQKRAELAALAQLHRQCAQAVLARTVPVLAEGTDALGCTPETVAALINTLFIAADRRGLHYPVDAAS